MEGQELRHKIFGYEEILMVPTVPNNDTSRSRSLGLQLKAKVELLRTHMAPSKHNAAVVTRYQNKSSNLQVQS